MVAAGALVIGAVGVAAAADSTPTPTPSGSAGAGEAPGPERGPRDGKGPGMRHFHRGGPGGGFGGGMEVRGAVRGEWVVPDGNGGFRTLATQRGEVTAVDSDSITVRSADGTSRTYVVDDETLVNSGRGGITDVEVGAQAHVTAVKNASTYTATHVIDVAAVRKHHERFAPPPPAAPPGGAATGPSGALPVPGEDLAPA